MDQNDVLLKQYELVYQHRLHLGKMFWQIPGVFFGICALSANVVIDRNFAGAFLWWPLLLTGIVIVLIAYAAQRHRHNEDQCAEILHAIERLFRTQFPSVCSIPRRESGEVALVV